MQQLEKKDVICYNLCIILCPFSPIRKGNNKQTQHSYRTIPLTDRAYEIRKGVWDSFPEQKEAPALGWTDTSMSQRKHWIKLCSNFSLTGLSAYKSTRNWRKNGVKPEALNAEALDHTGFFKEM